jgi:hypothetical protein
MSGKGVEPTEIFFHNYDSSLQMNQTQMCEILVSGQVMCLADLRPNRRYVVLRAQELLMCGREPFILIHILNYASRDGYVILPYHTLSPDDTNKINKYERIVKIIYGGVGSSNNPIVDFM